MKLIFLGTPEFAVPVLEALHHSKHEVLAVVTQPDRPKGRHLALTPSPVKIKALSLNLPLYQPEKVSEESFMNKMRQLKPDAAVVVAFGQIFKKDLLSLPKFGCWNVHASLLPKYRGAMPIARAIMAGEKESGISIMKMGAGIDDGAVLAISKTAISQNTTAGELESVLSQEGARLMVESLNFIEKGEFKLQEQDSTQATYAHKLDKKETHINWNQSAQKIHNLIRSLNPQPGAFTLWNKERLKIWKSAVFSQANGKPGEIIKIEKTYFLVAAKDGALALHEVQLPGKKKISASDFVKGYKINCGEILQ